MKRRPAILLARTLALLWAGFWLFFIVVESLAWNTPTPLMLRWIGVGLLFALLAVLPWRWEITGGILLSVTGVLAIVAYSIWPPPHLPLATRVITTLALGGAPVVAGILFLTYRRVSSTGG